MNNDFVMYGEIICNVVSSQQGLIYREILARINQIAVKTVPAFDIFYRHPKLGHGYRPKWRYVWELGVVVFLTDGNVNRLSLRQTLETIRSPDRRRVL